MKLIIKNIGEIATFIGNTPKKGQEMSELKIYHGYAIYIEENIIKDLDKEEEIIKRYPNATHYDALGKAVIPGLIDSHTHFVFGGYREDEFCDRLEGMSYEDIMKRGGGINNTVRETRKASFDDLMEKSLKVLKSFLSFGVTTIEGKSGYGLDLDTEVKQLKVMKELENIQPIEIVRTYLGAHDIPLEYKDKKDEYITFMIDEVMPKIKEEKLASFVDVFVEKGVYNIEEGRMILTKAKDLGFKVKVHADELSDLGGALLASDEKAISAEHLLYASKENIKKMASNNVIATLLPLTAFNLKKPYADARFFIDNNVAVGLASDYNPGSCFSENISLIFLLSTLFMNMSISEVLCALTINNACDLDIGDKVGTIEVGKKADIVILDYNSYKFIPYHIGVSSVNTVFKKGKIVYQKE